MRSIEAAAHDACVVVDRRRDGLCGDRGGRDRSGGGRRRGHGSGRSGRPRRPRANRSRLCGGRPGRLSGRSRCRLEHRSGGEARPAGRRRQLILIGLSVRYELTIARRAGARRHVARQATRPVRPVIGDIGGKCILIRGSGTGGEREAGAYGHDRRGMLAPAGNTACRLGKAARCSHRLPFAAPSGRDIAC